jgi:hypothetical protein
MSDRRIEVKIKADVSEFNRQLVKAQSIVTGRPQWWIRLKWWWHG